MLFDGLNFESILETSAKVLPSGRAENNKKWYPPNAQMFPKKHFGQIDNSPPSRKEKTTRAKQAAAFFACGHMAMQSTMYACVYIHGRTQTDQGMLTMTYTRT